MNAFTAIVAASLLARLSYQMARSPLLPRFAESLGAMPELVGVIVAASTLTGVLFKLPAGALSDLLGRRRVLLSGAIFFAAPPFLYPLVEGPGELLALRFLHGFATAIFSPVASAYVASLGAGARGARLGWFSSANDIGATLGPLAGGLVLYATGSFKESYLLLGAPGLLALILAFGIPEPAQKEERKAGAVAAQFWRALREVMAVRAILVASGVEALMYVGLGAFLGFLPLYAKRQALNDGEIGVVVAATLTVGILLKPLAGALSDRAGRKPVIVIGLFLVAAALPLIFHASSFAALLSAAPLLGLGVAAVSPATNALIADLVSERRVGTGMGVFGTIWDSGEAAGPILAGFLIGSFGYEPAFAAIAAAIAAAALLFGLLIPKPARE